MLSMADTLTLDLLLLTTPDLFINDPVKFSLEVGFAQLLLYSSGMGDLLKNCLGLENSDTLEASWKERVTSSGLRGMILR